MRNHNITKINDILNDNFDVMMKSHVAECDVFVCLIVVLFVSLFGQYFTMFDIQLGSSKQRELYIPAGLLNFQHMASYLVENIYYCVVCIYEHMNRNVCIIKRIM